MLMLVFGDAPKVLQVLTLADERRKAFVVCDDYQLEIVLASAHATHTPTDEKSTKSSKLADLQMLT